MTRESYAECLMILDAIEQMIEVINGMRSGGKYGDSVLPNWPYGRDCLLSLCKSIREDIRGETKGKKKRNK